MAAGDLSQHAAPEQITPSVVAEVHSISCWNDRSIKEKDSIRHHHQDPSWPKLPGRAELKQASAMFRALGDLARLRLLTRLSVGEACVSELADVEREKVSTVSARLKALNDVRLVKRRREAKHIYYSLSDIHVLRLMESIMEHAAERQKPAVSGEPRTRKEKRL